MCACEQGGKGSGVAINIFSVKGDHNQCFRLDDALCIHSAGGIDCTCQVHEREELGKLKNVIQGDSAETCELTRSDLYTKKTDLEAWRVFIFPFLFCFTGASSL